MNIVLFNQQNYQILLLGCKYAIKKKKIINKTNEELNLNESDDEG